MTTHFSTLQDLFEQAGGDLGDLLLTIFDAGVSYGMGLPHDTPQSPTVASLLETVRARWHAELRASRAEREQYDEPLTTDDLPGWLLSLPRVEAHDGGA